MTYLIYFFVETSIPSIIIKIGINKLIKSFHYNAYAIRKMVLFISFIIAINIQLKSNLEIHFFLFTEKKKIQNVINKDNIQCNTNITVTHISYSSE